MSSAAASPSVVSWAEPSMGGRLGLHVQAAAEGVARAGTHLRRTGRRVNAWAARLTRFTDDSDLSRLNASGEDRVAVRPTLGAVLDWGIQAGQRTGGVVDISMLKDRLAAETGKENAAGAAPAWSVTRAGRWHTVARRAGVAFDLDGVAKGWLADRALSLLCAWPAAIVDADGDLALHADPGHDWVIAIDDPRSDDAELTRLHLAGSSTWRRSFGLATSGTSVHRWQLADGRPAHHLLDPRTRRPAVTDVVQATVLAPSASEAEVLAKAVVILGSARALALLERAPALAAVLLTHSGEVLMSTGSEQWLA